MAEADKTKAAELSPESGPGPQNGPAPESGNSEKEQRAGDDAARNETESVDGEPAGAKTDEPMDEQTDEPTREQAGADDDADDFAALSPQALIEHLNEAKAETTRLKDGLLRARAEVENIRRRSQNEIVAARKFAIEGFAQELLGVRDSLERASSVELDEGAGDAVQQMKEGLGLTLKQLDIAMAKFAVVEVEAGPGVRFDPERHQAISTATSADIEAGHIVAVVQKGFLLKERLLRPAMVVVAAKDDGQAGGEHHG